MAYYIAVDVGGTQMRAASYHGDDIEPLHFIRRSTHHESNTPEENLKRIIQEVWPSGKPVAAICVATPAPIDLAAGVIVKAPNISEWQHFPVVHYLHDIFQVPVMLDNDANLAALGEWKFGAGRGHHHLVYVTVSTGIGGGIIIADQLLHGIRGLAAEIGHITVDPNGPLCACGHYGHLEAVASGTAIARQAREAIHRGAHSLLSEVPEITAKSVAEAAAQGDHLAAGIMRTAGNWLGRAFADFLHIFNPSALILGGGVMQSGDLILDPIRESLTEHALSPEYLEGLTLTIAELGDEPGLVGAMVMASTSFPR
jgi:glucokinase